MAETLVHAAVNVTTANDAVGKARRMSWVAENVCALHGIQVVEQGELPETPCVLVANHVSYVEPIALASRFRATAIAKKEVGEWPVVGQAVRSLGVMLVDRSSPASGARVLFEAWDRLRAGVSVVVFPEGTTTSGDDVLPFRRGIFGIAKLAGVPIIPVAIRYDGPEVAWIGDDPFLPHYLRTTSRERTRCYMTYGAPLETERTDLDADELAELARVRIRSMLRRH
jgi:1-acyl-sn-glycerol-3-phosphate acyltransferase